jgi:hypothetical protein
MEQLAVLAQMEQLVYKEVLAQMEQLAVLAQMEQLAQLVLRVL